MTPLALMEACHWGGGQHVFSWPTTAEKSTNKHANLCIVFYWKLNDHIIHPSYLYALVGYGAKALLLIASNLMTRFAFISWFTEFLKLLIMFIKILNPKKTSLFFCFNRFYHLRCRYKAKFNLSSTTNI